MTANFGPSADVLFTTPHGLSQMSGRSHVAWPWGSISLSSYLLSAPTLWPPPPVPHRPAQCNPVPHSHHPTLSPKHPGQTLEIYTQVSWNQKKVQFGFVGLDLQVLKCCARTGCFQINSKKTCLASVDSTALPNKPCKCVCLGGGDNRLYKLKRGQLDHVLISYMS